MLQIALTHPSQIIFRSPSINVLSWTSLRKIGSSISGVDQENFPKAVFRETLDGLRRVGFRLNTGIDGTGFILLAWTKASGYYFGATITEYLLRHRTVIRNTDVGASQLIIDGKIKLKNDSQISRFTKNGLEFTNGSTLDADTVVFATGYKVFFLPHNDA